MGSQSKSKSKSSNNNNNNNGNQSATSTIHSSSKFQEHKWLRLCTTCMHLLHGTL